MATRTSSATWEGNLKEGKGTMKVGRGAYEGPFSFASRFENGAGTNPEELIGAAEAGCFSMALSANLSKAGHQPKSVHTIAKVNLEMIGGGPKITKSGVAKLSVVGIGMRSHSGVAAKFFDCLGRGGINIQLISTSEIKIAVVINETEADQAARLAHEAFGLARLGPVATAI